MKLWLALIFGLLLGENSLAAQKPNIVMFFIDDWAWNGTPARMDDGMPNSKMPVLHMPNLEKMISEGMKFRNAYSGAPQCSPSRVCLQTGKSAPRSGFTVFMNSRSDYYDTRRSYSQFPVIPCVSDMTIDEDAVTIPEALNPLGYACAHFGKWHMRGSPEDEGYIAHDGPTTNNEGNTIAGQSVLPDNMTDPKLMFSITKRSNEFMDAQAKAKRPFYLQISHYAMHEGRECLPQTRQKYVNHPAVRAYYESVNKTPDTINRKQDPAIWLGMGEDLDSCIGEVLRKIEELGIEDNTYVIMTSDNGYRHSFYPGLTQPLHGGKWWAWQGGLRVPMVVKGPGIKPGSVFAANVVNYDLLPTFVEWAGGDPAKLKDIDGISLAGMVAGKKPTDEFRNRFLYFHYPHYRTSMPHSAIVMGSRKVMHFYERPDIPIMFDLAADEGEVKNIANEHSNEHKKLYDELMNYMDRVGARKPRINPNYDETVYKKAKEHSMRMKWGPFEGQRPLEDDEK